MKRIITLIAALALAGCAVQQPAPQSNTPTAKKSMAELNAMMADYAKCQRLGYLAATDGDKDEIGALKFDIKSRVRAKTIQVDRLQCAEAINRGKSEGFEARNKAEAALADAAKRAW